MSSGIVSLESSIRTCKVDAGYASKIESDRFLNPSNMICPAWSGYDLAGRSVCPDSFWTKNAGCHSANDRVVVENAVSRPQYMEYITLSANGIKGDIYGTTTSKANSVHRNNVLKGAHAVTGQFGNVSGYQANVYPKCGVNAYRNAMAQVAQQNRQVQSGNIRSQARARQLSSGCQ